MDHDEAQSGPEKAEEKSKEAKTEELSMESLLAQGEFSLDMPRQGEIRKGVIASITDEEILVSIGAKSEGVIPGRELPQLPEEEREQLAVGKEIQVYVVSPESRQGTMILSNALGGALGPWLGGFLHDVTGSYFIVLVVVQILIAVAAVLMWIIKPRVGKTPR